MQITSLDELAANSDWRNATLLIISAFEQKGSLAVKLNSYLNDYWSDNFDKELYTCLRKLSRETSIVVSVNDHKEIYISIKQKPLTGAQRRKLRVSKGLPRYTEQEAKYYKNYLKKNRNKYNRNKYLKIKSLLNEIKLERGCIDCGYNNHPAALDFDHLPEFEKLGTISESRSFKFVLQEIEKCEVVCANCHRIRTATRKKNKM